MTETAPYIINAMADDLVVPVFPGDHDERTCAAGILSDDGTELVRSMYNPALIEEVARRLQNIAAEIRANGTYPTITPRVAPVTNLFHRR